MDRRIQSLRSIGATLTCVCAMTMPGVAHAQTAAPEETPPAWHTGEQVPIGYHTVHREHTGPVTLGAVVWALPFIASAVEAADSYPSQSWTYSSRWPLWIPGVGPFGTLGYGNSTLGNTVLVLDGLTQLTGIAIFVYGIATPRTELERDATMSLPSVTVAPVALGRTPGLAVVGVF